MSRRRVVITGMGTVNPLANDVPAYWRSLLAGRSGIGPITLFDTAAFKVHFGGEVKDFHPETVLNPKDVRRLDRFTQFAMIASLDAVRDSGIDFSKENAFRCGAIIGSGIGGLNEFEEQHTIYIQKGPNRIGPFVIPKMIANCAAGTVSIHYGLMGPNTAIATACASAANAIGDAFLRDPIRSRRRDDHRRLRGGHRATWGSADSFPLGLFDAERRPAWRQPPVRQRPRRLRPGRGRRDPHPRRAPSTRAARREIVAELLGVGCTADGYHITAPHPEGVGAIMAMQLRPLKTLDSIPTMSAI